MLILARKLNQKIMVGDDVCLTVTDIDSERNQVKIGIEAPKHVAVHRREIFERIQRERNG